MGVDVQAQETLESSYVNALHTLEDTIIYRATKPWLMNDKIFSWTKTYKQNCEALKTAEEKSLQVIRDRKKIREQSTGEFNGKRKAFLDLVLDMGELTDE